MSWRFTALLCRGRTPGVPPVFRVEVSTAEQLEQALSIRQLEYIYAPLHIVKPHERVIVIPPLFGEADLSGYSHVCVQTVNHFYEGVTLHGGFRLNITNSAAQRQYEQLGLTDTTLSIELSLHKAKAVEFTVPRGLIVYGNLPMMYRRGTVNYNELTDRKGKTLPIIHANNEHEILNPNPLYLADKLNDFTDFDFFILRLSPGECVQDVYNIHTLCTQHTHDIHMNNFFSRGLYYK